MNHSPTMFASQQNQILVEQSFGGRRRKWRVTLPGKPFALGLRPLPVAIVCLCPFFACARPQSLGFASGFQSCGLPHMRGRMAPQGPTPKPCPEYVSGLLACFTRGWAPPFLPDRGREIRQFVAGLSCSSRAVVD